MKKLFALGALLGLSIFASAQEVEAKSNWTVKGVGGINLSQTSLTNWAAGGDNSVAWHLYLNGSANYKKDRWSWDNSLITDFGNTYTSTDKWQKSLDKLNITTKLGYAIAPKWNLSFLGDFLTQFSTGYSSAADKRNGVPYISNFMAPGYLTLALGADYKPNDNFSLLLSPVTGKLTFVTDSRLSNAGAYGVQPGKKLFAELGASLVANYNQKITENINLISKLTLFSAYNHDFGNIDVNWDVMLAFKVNKFISATFSTNLVYDDDIKTPSGGPKVQLRQTLGIGLSYNF